MPTLGAAASLLRSSITCPGHQGRGSSTAQLAHPAGEVMRCDPRPGGGRGVHASKLPCPPLPCPLAPRRSHPPAAPWCPGGVHRSGSSCWSPRCAAAPCPSAGRPAQRGGWRGRLQADSCGQRGQEPRRLPSPHALCIPPPPRPAPHIVVEVPEAAVGQLVGQVYAHQARRLIGPAARHLHRRRGGGLLRQYWPGHQAWQSNRHGAGPARHQRCSTVPGVLTLRSVYPPPPTTTMGSLYLQPTTSSTRA